MTPEEILESQTVYFDRDDYAQQQPYWFKEDVLKAMQEYADQFKPKWISIEERLPGREEDMKTGRYWCYVEGINDLGISHYQWNCSFDLSKQVFNCDNGDRVTHWMPLPENP